MRERPTYRATQQVRSRSRDSAGDVYDSSGKRRVDSLSGDTPPSVDAVRKHFKYADWMSSQAEYGNIHQLTSYEAGDINIDVLRMNAAGRLLSRLGLRQLIPYDPYMVVRREDVELAESH